MSDGVASGVACIAILLNVGFVVLSAIVRREFSWRVFRYHGGDTRKRALYRKLMAFQTSFKLELLLSVLLTGLILTLWFGNPGQQTSWQLIAATASLSVMPLYEGVVYVAVLQEQAQLAIASVPVGLAQCIVLIYFLAVESARQQDIMESNNSRMWRGLLHEKQIAVIASLLRGMLIMYSCVLVRYVFLQDLRLRETLNRDIALRWISRFFVPLVVCRCRASPMARWSSCVSSTGATRRRADSQSKSDALCSSISSSACFDGRTSTTSGSTRLSAWF